MAQTDCFLKIDGIDGESTDDQFANWIELKSWSWGANNNRGHAGATSSGTGKVAMHDMSFTALTNAASPSVAQACATGKPIASAELDCRVSGNPPQVKMKIKLTDVYVSSYQTGSSEGNSVHPTDTFTLNYGKIEFSYGKQDDKGKVNTLDKKMSHDLRTNKPS